MLRFYANELCITSNYLEYYAESNIKNLLLHLLRKEFCWKLLKQMLHSSDKSIKEIAFELGFRNFSHFSYFFRTEAGTTPKTTDRQ